MTFTTRKSIAIKSLILASASAAILLNVVGGAGYITEAPAAVVTSPYPSAAQLALRADCHRVCISRWHGVCTQYGIYCTGGPDGTVRG